MMSFPTISLLQKDRIDKWLVRIFRRRNSVNVGF